VQSQSYRPAEVLVVDDSSDDDTRAICDRRGVKYLRVDYRSVYFARRDGMNATKSPLIVFLDADDKLAPTYIAECVAVMNADQRTAVVTSGLQHFGDSSKVVNHLPCEIERQNWIHAGSMVRRLALEVTAAYERTAPPINSHADWFVWREVIRGGWNAERISSASYLYRQHAESMLRAERSTDYYDVASLAMEPITLVLPLSGREQYWPRLSQWAEQQSRVTDIIVIDSSSDPAFRSKVKAWLNERDVRSAKYVSLPPSNGLADAERKIGNDAYRGVQRAMPRVYRNLRESLTTEFAMIVEDDVLPPVDTIERLLRSMGENVAAVSGVVPSRFVIGDAIAWRANQNPIKLNSTHNTVERVGGTGFGCLLLRRSSLDSALPFHHGGPSGNYDIEVTREIGATGLAWLMDWSIRCVHGEGATPAAK